MADGKVFWDIAAMESAGRTPSVLAIGDSWFWYPLFGGSLINRLGALLNNDHCILVVGNNGAEAYDYVHGKYQKEVDRALNLYGDGLSAVFISGGGNDFAGFTDLRPMLVADASAATTATDCFKEGLAEKTLGWLMDRTGGAYRDLIAVIRGYVPRSAKILFHNYDYARPTGRGVFGEHGSWLQPALADAQVPEALRQSCVDHVIDQLSNRLQAIAAQDLGQLRLVDTNKTLLPAEWANELHPSPAGFSKLAEKWRPHFAQFGWL